LQAANYQSLEYSSSDPVQVDLTIRFDNALQTPIGNGLGATVGRTLGEVITG